MIPSRDSNPFATCWTSPGALAFRFAPNQNAERLVAQLRESGWWGEIVGPHGSGKSTLLAALVPALVAAGRTVHTVALRDGQRRLPSELASRALSSSAATLVVDGYEQLGWLARVSLRWRCRRAAAGLLVTTHVASGLPTLVALAPDLPLVQQLVADLSQRVATPVTAADVAACYACHGSNVREILFDLYDRHECIKRSARTIEACGA